MREKEVTAYVDVFAADQDPRVRLFTKKDAATRVGRSVRTIERWISRGLLPQTLGRIREIDLLEAESVAENEHRGRRERAALGSSFDSSAALDAAAFVAVGVLVDQFTDSHGMDRSATVRAFRRALTRNNVAP